MEGEKKKKKFTKKQLRSSQGMLTQQAQTNIYANQTGMTTFGAVRHGADIRVRELYDCPSDECLTDEEEEVKPTRSRRREEKPVEQVEDGGGDGQQ
jgi:hypothetical protein